MLCCRLPVKTRPDRVPPLTWACNPGGDGPLQPDLTDPFEELPVLNSFHPVHCFADELGGTPVRETLDHAVKSGRLVWAERETSTHCCSAHGWQPLLTYHILGRINGRGNVVCACLRIQHGTP